MRIPLRVSRLQPHLPEQPRNPRRYDVPRHPPRVQRLGNDVTHRHPRIETRHGILRHDLHGPAQQPCRTPGQPRDILPEDLHGAGLRCRERHDLHEHRGLPGPGLPDEREGLTAAYLQVDLLHGDDRPLATAPAAGRDVGLGQTADA